MRVQHQPPSQFPESIQTRDLHSQGNSEQSSTSKRIVDTALDTLSGLSILGMSYAAAGVLLHATLTATKSASQFLYELPVSATVFCSILVAQTVLYKSIKKR